MIVRHIVDQGTISPSADANWSFVPMVGATVLFETDPGGAACADGVPGVTPEELRTSEDDVLRYRMTM